MLPKRRWIGLQDRGKYSGVGATMDIPQDAPEAHTTEMGM